MLNRKTNRYECKYLPAQRVSKTVSKSTARSSQGLAPSSARNNHPRYEDHRVRSSSNRPRTRKPPATDDRVPSFVQTESEKQGKGSCIPDLVHYARECPVAWTSKMTTQNMNLGLFLNFWQVELVRPLFLRMESWKPDSFCHDAWKAARLYHSKEQQKLDSECLTGSRCMSSGVGQHFLTS